MGLCWLRGHFDEQLKPCRGDKKAPQILQGPPQVQCCQAGAPRLPRFKKKEELFLDQLPVLFNITVKSLIPSNLITAEDRSFLLHNWGKTITGTTLEVPPDILSIVALVSDRLSLTHNQLTVITAALVNHCGGDIHKIALSKSTSRRSRDSSRRSVLTTIKRNFSCALGQVNFD